MEISPLTHEVLSDLAPDLQAAVLAGSRAVSYPSAALIYTPNDGRLAAIVRSGLLRVYIGSRDGRQATIRYVRPGQVIGVTAFTGVALPANMQVVAAARLTYLDLERFAELVRGEVDIANWLCRDIAVRYIHLTQICSVLAFGTALEKVAFGILERACQEQLVSEQLAFRATHQEIGQAVNASREVVTRSIARLRARGIIEAGGGLIRVRSVVRLEQLACRPGRPRGCLTASASDLDHRHR